MTPAFYAALRRVRTLSPQDNRPGCSLFDAAQPGETLDVLRPDNYHSATVSGAVKGLSDSVP